MTENYLNLRKSLDTLRVDLVELSSKSIVELEDKKDDIQLIKDLCLNPAKKKTLLITRWEPNHCHGTGILLSRVLDTQTYVILKSNDFWIKEGGPGPFKSYQINVEEKSRPAIFSLVLEFLAQEKFDRILFVPAHREEYIIAIAAKYILNVPLVVWAMDEFLIVKNELMAELFSLADIVFVISAEMRDYYEGQFQRKFYVLPPTVKSSLIGCYNRFDISSNLTEKICIMVGNVWARPWLEGLFRMIKASGWMVHWYGMGSALGELKTSKEELREHGIIEKGYLPENEFLKHLATYPFAVIPSGFEENKGTAKGITPFSLPSRLPFLLAVTHTPILLVGNQESCAAKFVRRFGVGLTVNYEEKAFVEAVYKLSDREFLAQCSARAVQAAHLFSDEGLEVWIWKSCEKGKPIDDRFEQAFRRQEGNLSPYREESLPQDLEKTLWPLYGILYRLNHYGYQPNFFIDMGTSEEACFSMIRRIFPSVHLVFIKFPEVEKASLSSVLIHKGVNGRGILRLDAQSTEWLIGGRLDTMLPQVDVIILELAVRTLMAGNKTFIEIIDFMESLGFQYFDDARDWRSSVSGILQRKEILFVHEKSISTFLKH